MAYTALYRKFRPHTFAGVIGQEHIVRTLKNEMQTGRVSHAYLFCGTRGTGKTSTAKIFARAINCLAPAEDGEPCNVCEICKDHLEGRSVNVIEIDAASNNSVDNIREIREEVKYAPAQGRFKVYIIDEVHMLSNSAFNALLKTLEEPPAHVIFILATTDPQKVPRTILSRVQRFDFRRITTEDIAETLMGYLAEEGHRATPEAVRYVAQLGDGSMRDSLSILDQCLAFFSGEEVTLEKVLDIMGAVDREVFFELTQALAAKDVKKAMQIVEEMMLSGRDVKQFVTELLQHLRNLLLAATVPNTAQIADFSGEEAARLSAAALSPAELIYYIEQFSALHSELKYAPNERILLEVELMKLCAPWTEQNLTALAAKVGELERKLAEGVQVVAVAAEPTEQPKEQPRPKPRRRPPALSEDRKKMKEQWAMIRNDVKDDDILLRGALEKSEVGFKEDDFLYLVFEETVYMKMAERKKEVVQELLENAAGKSFELRFTTEKEFEQWYQESYGDAAQTAGDDAEFASLMGSYFPDADIEE